MALLVLPLLAFVAAQESSRGLLENNQQQNEGEAIVPLFEARRAVNGTEIVLECPAAAQLVRTHMAPDFEHPQLVRRLDWIHEGQLVASFHQESLSDISQQWWVSSGRFELRRPFFELRIGPVLAQDAGQWRCRLETDPLFAADLPQRGNGAQLLVLLKPPVPPRPSILRHSDHSVSLDWAKFASAPAHQPILRFSVLVAQPEDGVAGAAGTMRVLSTPDNKTEVDVAGLRPNTRYAFSVRAENAVGESAFGPETLFRTVGLPPKKSPEIRSLRNGTTPDCVDLEWELPGADQEPTPIVGFRIMVHRVGTGAMREWYVKGGRARAQPLCSLEPHADYVLSLEADNGFGYSTGTTAPFRTEQSIPDGPPQLVQFQPLPGGTSLALSWRQPLVPNGLIRAFFIYFKEVPSQRAPGQIRLDVAQSAEGASKAFAFNLTKLAPNTRYKLRVSAATDKGEGPKSEAVLVDTDFEAPKEGPKVSNLSFACDNSLLSLAWTGPALPDGAEGIYHISVHSSMVTKPRLFNISAGSPQKLLLDQVQLGERLSVTVQLHLKSRAQPGLLLNGPISPMAHFALISNGWRCRFRSSACPSASSLPPSSICEHFPESAVAQQGAALMGQQPSSGGAALANEGAKMVDANMSFIFLIFGAAITLAISLLFGCILRRRCLLLKSLLNERRSTKGPEKWRSNGNCGPESVSLVKKAAGKEAFGPAGTNTDCSVVLPPITADNGGQCSNGQVEGNVEAEAIASKSSVNVLQFEAHFQAMAADGMAGFRRQFQEIERDTALLLEGEEDVEEGEEKKPEEGGEKTKDRYIDVGALPRRSRIRLLDSQGRRGAYINANFVDSCDQQRAYIATQAPLPHTFADFWAMVWQEHCRVLVALTNMVESGRRKCDQYWPERVGGQLQSGQFLVQLSAERSNSVFTHRVLQLNKRTADGRTLGEQSRTLHQLHFMAWPDHGVPESPFPLLHFTNYVADLQCSSSTDTGTTGDGAPCLVHCSAGVGRSGAFILIDSLRRHLLRSDQLDVGGHLLRMRRQRAQLVQTLEQFVFCHEVLRHLVANGISRQPRSHFPNYCRFLFSKCTPAGQPRIQAQFQELLACPHDGHCVSQSVGHIQLPGYHRHDEFLLFTGVPADKNQLWLAIWEAKCQSLAILDSRPSSPAINGQIDVLDGFPLPSIIEEQEGKGKRILVERAGHGQVRMRREGEEQPHSVCIHRMATAALLANPWAELEQLQLQLLDQHQGQLALLELSSPCRQGRTSAAPFLFCALQSAACQLEQEAAVDVLLWLASYRHASCGCWTDLAEIELIYRKVLELVEMQRSLC